MSKLQRDAKDYATLERYHEKRTRYMRQALNAIIGSENEASADDLREIALTALEADTKLEDKEYEKLG